MSCDSPPLAPFQPARRNTEIDGIMGNGTYTQHYTCVWREKGHFHTVEKEAQSNQCRQKGRWFIHSMLGVQSERGQSGVKQSNLGKGHNVIRRERRGSDGRGVGGRRGVSNAALG